MTDKSVVFKAWPKIPRTSPFKTVITEKMDGTNACVIVQDGEVVGAQSRKRLITPENDNYGFAAWVEEHRQELSELGDGYHFGEWVGPGIQKNPHGLKEKTFFLFNTGRWNKDNVPSCCKVVPVLHTGMVTGETIETVMKRLLKQYESRDGHPEGIIIYNCTYDAYSKVTFNGNKAKT